MPRLTSEQEDAVFEAISKQLYRLNNVVKGMFGQELSDDELRRAYQRVNQGVNQAIEQQQRPRPPQPAMRPQPPRAVNPADLVEGGFVNDASGQATVQMRRSLGIGGP